jgi:predicted permease
MRRLAFFQELWERIRRKPGVESAGGVSILPLAGGIGWGSITIEGYNPVFGQDAIQADSRTASVGYFETMNVPLLRGRFFTEQDSKDSMQVAIVDEKMVRAYWPNTDPIGKRLKFGGENSKAPWMTVVGVVANVKQYALDIDSRVALYIPHLQSPDNTMYAVARTTVDPLSVAAAITREARSIDPNTPVFDVKTMDQLLSESLARRRFSMLALGLFALVAMALAAVGIYGVISYAVAQRTRGIGVRIALGAQTRDVLNLVLRQGMSLALVGGGLGLFAAFALTRVMSGLLFGVSATDSLTFIVITLSLMAVALVACIVPARRAAKVDPMIALRFE